MSVRNRSHRSSGMAFTWLVVAGLLPGASTAPLLASAQNIDPLRDISIIEDRRSENERDVARLLTYSRSTDPVVARMAIRAMGRFERNTLLTPLLDGITHRDQGVRSEAANAVAQTSLAFATLSPEERTSALATARDALVAAVRIENSAPTAAVILRSLARLPLRSAADVALVDSLISTRLAAATSNSVRTELTLAAERLVRSHSRLQAPSDALADALRAVLQGANTDAYARHLAVAALSAARRIDVSSWRVLLGDNDPQVRRAALVVLATNDSLPDRAALVLSALDDSSPIVQVEAARNYLRRGRTESCAPLLARISESHPSRSLVLLDALAEAQVRCNGADVAAVTDQLSQLAARLQGTDSRDGSRTAAIRSAIGARALLTLSRVAPEAAGQLLGVSANHPSWVVAMYRVRAAAIVGDTTAVRVGRTHQHQNVRAAALAELSRLTAHRSDELYAASLSDPDYGVVLAAANALRQAPPSAAIVSALYNALDRITAEKKETSRDPRIAIVTRLGEMASPADSARLTAYLEDFDPVVASRVAGILSRWTSRTIEARPRTMAAPDSLPLSPAELQGVRVRFTMSRAAGGGVFEVELLSDDAPFAATRFLRLVDSGYYDGLTFHRIVPNFVAQGGSPGANEYVGDGPFMRDEISLASQQRGTLGISTRGRDTGDAQIYINLIDNPRLDFDYTVFARVASGMETIDALLEGDVIESARIIRP